MNPLLKRALGESVSGDVVPVLANVTRASYQDRLSRMRARRGEPEKDNDMDESNDVRRLTRGIRRSVKESEQDDYVIPDDADDVSAEEMTVGKPLREPKDIVQEPSHPTAEKEKLNTPYAALTAPDVTPQSTQPIDPSRVPGATGPEKFTAADLKTAQPTTTTGGKDIEIDPMSVLLGHDRVPRPARTPEEFQQAGAITTEEAAIRALGISTPLQEEATAKAANALVSSIDGGGAMPPPPPMGDGSAIYSAFRRFTA